MIKINIGFLGAGKVAFSIGKYISLNKECNISYYSKDYKDAVKASTFVGGKAYKDINTFVKDNDLLFITTNDSNILNAYLSIKDYLKNIKKDKIICHCSGVLSSKIFFKKDISSNLYFYTIHPIYPFSTKFDSYNLKDVYFTIEGDLKYLDFLCNYFKSMNTNIKVIDSNNKEKYHLSCVICSNLIIPLINKSLKYLKNIGFGEEEALNCLKPLINTNINNLFEKGINKSITGPASRKDFETLNKHLNIINASDFNIYKDLTLEIFDILNIKFDESKFEVKD